MKTMLRTILIALVVLVSVPSLKAQSKIAYINTDSILLVMPDYDSAEKKMTVYGKQFDDQLAKMGDELGKLEEDYQKNYTAWAPTIRELKEQDIMDKRQKIEKFQQKANADITAKQQELMAPIVKKLKDAVAEVAKEKGYTMVLSNSAGVILYSLPTDDIFNDVKKKLGIK